MTRDVALLRKVGSTLLRFQRQPFTLRRWLVAADVFDLAEPAAAKALYEVWHRRLCRLTPQYAALIACTKISFYGEHLAFTNMFWSRFSRLLPLQNRALRRCWTLCNGTIVSEIPI